MPPERPLRRHLAPWLFSALLLAAQQWALWHPLQHLPHEAHAAQPGHAHEEPSSTEADCPICLALATLALAAPPTADGGNGRAPGHATPGDTARPWVPGGTLARHNRGPPAAA